MPGSDWLRDELTKYAFTDESMDDRPDEWYIALFTDDETEVGGGDDSNYERQEVTFEIFGGTPGRARNEDLVAFPAAASGSSYTVTHWAVYTDDSGGEQLLVQELEFPRSMSEGDVIAFAQGDLVAGIGG